MSRHFYSTNANEVAQCCNSNEGWQLEGVACFVYANDMTAWAKACNLNFVKKLERYWNGDLSDHFYTINPTAENLDGYSYEGTAGWVFSGDAPNSFYTSMMDHSEETNIRTIPLYRLWNDKTGEHFYTTSENEKNAAIGAGFSDQGIACCVPEQPGNGIGTPRASPLFRLWNTKWGESPWYNGITDSAAWVWNEIKGPVVDFLAASLAGAVVALLGGGDKAKAQENDTTGAIDASLTTGSSILSPWTAFGASRGKDLLDVVLTASDGRVITAGRSPRRLVQPIGKTDVLPNPWSPWSQIAGGVATPRSPVTVVSRGPNKLDVFVVGVDNGVWTAAWEPDFADGWHGWWRIGNIAAPFGACIGAASRSLDHLDIFVTDVNGQILTAAWEPGFADGWHGWWPVAGGAATPGAPVSAVSRSADKLDVFVVGADGRVLTAAWEPGFADGWHGWWPVAGGAAAPGAPVAAVSRGPDKLDVFVVGADGGVWTAAWEPGFADGWRGWSRIGNITAPFGAYVGAASRSPDHLDIFISDVSGRILTAAWQPAFTDGWHGWWPIAGGFTTPGAPVTAVSCDVDELDLFVVGQEGSVLTASWEPSFTDGWHGWQPAGTLPPVPPVR